MSGDATVSVVIVNWNRRDSVLSLLDSLLLLEQRALTVIVVDNASTDGSAAAIQQHPLPVVLLENRENLGGSGGFNTGIRHALQQLEQQFIWLLDNDAEVTPVTLAALLKVMEEDPSVGVAGSCIMSPEDHSLIVEAGGFVDQATASWRPHLRYQCYQQLHGRVLVEEVDYVPACSALVRCEVLAKVGLLDERFFLHWDDIDFCARVRGAGLRVVAAFGSQVFHGAEKGHSRITLYYDFRNALLYFSKHARLPGLLRPQWALLARNLVSSVYLQLTGKKQSAAFLFQAMTDFLGERFGRMSMPTGVGTAEAAGEELPLEEALSQDGKVLLFAVGRYDEVVAAVRKVKGAAPRVSVSIAVAADRAEAYRLPEVDRLVVFDLFRDGLFRRLANAAGILAGGYLLGISAGSSFTVPYAYFLRRNLIFDAASGTFRSCEVRLSSLWKLPLSMLVGNIMALVFLAPVLLVGKRQRDVA